MNPSDIPQKWKIIYYQSQSGDYPVAEFIDGLDKKAKAKIINTFTLLEDFGIKLGSPRAEKLKGTDLWELRILGSDNIRIFYIAITGKTFLLLHGFYKKKQKTDRREIKTAEDRLLDFNSRKK